MIEAIQKAVAEGFGVIIEPSCMHKSTNVVVFKASDYKKQLGYSVKSEVINDKLLTELIENSVNAIKGGSK